MASFGIVTHAVRQILGANKVRNGTIHRKDCAQCLYLQVHHAVAAAPGMSIINKSALQQVKINVAQHSKITLSISPKNPDVSGGMVCRAFATSSVVADANKSINIGFVGAGGVSFGTAEGPWNHSVRLEKMSNVQFTAIIDPNLELAQVWQLWQNVMAFFQYCDMFIICHEGCFSLKGSSLFRRKGWTI